jgi:hypothetical protein
MNDDERRSISSLEAEEARLERTRFDNVDAGPLSSGLVVAATGRSPGRDAAIGAGVPGLARFVVYVTPTGSARARSRAASRPGGRPNWRRYSRLNCEVLS